MNFSSAILRIWNECILAFSSTGYSFFKIEAHIVCAIVLALLFNRQQNSSDQTESRIVWCRLVLVHVMYCLSGILRVFPDIGIVPSNSVTEYIFTALNFSVFSGMCWLIFIYTESCYRTGLLDSFTHKIIASVPFIMSIFTLIAYPLILTYTGMKHNSMAMNHTVFSIIILVLSLIYPLGAVIHIYFRRNNQDMNKLAIYPALFFVFAVIQSLNWKMPLLCYVVMASDVFVYINYTDSLVSLDPLTKIPNRNGLIRYLTERIKKGDTDNLYVFAVDIDDLDSVNAKYGRSEGDRALIITANALKRFRSEAHKCYASRYYSDEFIIAADIETEDELELFTEHIRNYISNASITNGLAYYIRVSIGYSHYEQYSRTETIAGLIEETDKSMTENKEHRKFQNIWQKGIKA